MRAKGAQNNRVRRRRRRILDRVRHLARAHHDPTVQRRRRGKFFKYSVFLVLNNELLAVCAALCILVAIKGNVKPVAPIYSYATVSASNVVATTCQYEALMRLRFPCKRLGSAKDDSSDDLGIFHQSEAIRRS